MPHPLVAYASRHGVASGAPRDVSVWVQTETIRWTLRVAGEPSPTLAPAIVKAVERSLVLSFDRIEGPWSIGWEPSSLSADWFAEQISNRRETSPMIATSDERTTLTWARTPVALDAGLPRASQIVIRAPLDAGFVAAAERCLAEVGVASGAHVAKVSTSIGERGLAGIREVTAVSGSGFRALPLALGWLNYWSAETCMLLGFPDPARDGRVLKRARKLPNDGWLVRVTDEPLDPVTRPDHVRALVDAYTRFLSAG